MKWILLVILWNGDAYTVLDMDGANVFDESHQCKAVGATLQSTRQNVVDFTCFGVNR